MRTSFYDLPELFCLKDRPLDSYVLFFSGWFRKMLRDEERGDQPDGGLQGRAEVVAGQAESARKNGTRNQVKWDCERSKLMLCRSHVAASFICGCDV